MTDGMTEEEHLRLAITRTRVRTCIKELVDEDFGFPEIYAASAETTIRLLVSAFPDPVDRAPFVGMLLELAMTDVKPAKNGDRKKN